MRLVFVFIRAAELWLDGLFDRFRANRHEPVAHVTRCCDSPFIQMERMMRSVGKEHLLTRLEYPDAGHLIEPPYSPHFRATNFMWDYKKAKGG